MKQGTARNIQAILLGIVCFSASFGVQAKSPDGKVAPDQSGRYIVLLEEAPLARHMADQQRQSAAQGKSKNTPLSWKLDSRSPASKSYLQHLDSRFEEFRAEAEVALSRELQTVHRYKTALNGFSARMTAKEAEAMAKMPGVKQVHRDWTARMETDAGPQWIGADDIWTGEGFITPTGGEGVVIGIIDGGINWEHNSFGDPGEGEDIPNNHDHVNPYGQELGLCSDPEVECNDKLVGVYDFIEDDPDTELVEVNTKGRDAGGHGSHVASTAAGNPGGVLFGPTPLAISGVAPNATIISYRVCYEDEEGGVGGACQGSAILAGIDQAVQDGVDVINYSIGGGPFSPWDSEDALGFLNAFDAGIFVATSAGNSGPFDGTIGDPAIAPWITSVGSATHNRIFTSILKATQGGDTAPPGDLFGSSFTADGVSQTTIVHAKDFGNALCGTGEPESGATCADNTGASNPFAPGTFNGEIVVCDRGEYGRIEKGKNLLEAGAGGYVLANTDEQGEETVNDNHCLPATHLGDSDGDELRSWLDSGSGHMASLTGFRVVTNDASGDRLSGFSSRGPNAFPAQDVLKPNLIAPGDAIVGASATPGTYILIGGTSMASPHVAGGAALLKALDPNMTPSMISSVLETTATTEQATDENGIPATHLESGAGRPVMGDAAQAGLYFEETTENYVASNPDIGGDPRTLNLPTLTDTTCQSVCSFKRTVKPLVNNRTWTVSNSGFPAGTVVTVSPEQFVLNSNSSQELDITIDLTGSETVGDWVFGKIILTANNIPPAVMPVSLFAADTSEWVILTDQDSGSQTFSIRGLDMLPDATYQTGGLVEPTFTSESIIEDPTWDDMYDEGEGVFFVMETVPTGALWLHAEVLPSESADVDLFVGIDSNGNGKPDENEEVCASTTSTNIEFCDITNPEKGDWWILVQNWEDGEDPSEPGNTPQEITVVTGVVDDGSEVLMATGPGIVPEGDNIDVKVSWQNVNAKNGAILLGAVGIGSERNDPNNAAVVPVYFVRTGIAEPSTVVLMNGRESAFALEAGEVHDKAFIDVPDGATSLTVSAKGGSSNQSNGLKLELYRMPFGQAFGDAPFAEAAPTNGAPAGSDTGGSQGPSVTLSGGDLTSGRWYAVLSNQGGGDAEVEMQADVDFSGTPVDLHPGLWQPSSRPTISQGYEYNAAGSQRAFLWYTYDDDGNPTWYISASPEQDGNIWTSDLLRFTNDGSKQQFVVVGAVSITLLGESDSIFSFSVQGEMGSDRMIPSSPLTCPNINGKKSYTGLWYRGVDGLGGASVLVNDIAQAQVHYLYDDAGFPRWLIAADDANQSPTTTELPMLQFKGFCPTCTGSVSFDTVGTVTREFSNETTGSWTLDFMLNPPLSGNVNRTDSIVKITDTIACD